MYLNVYYYSLKVIKFSILRGNSGDAILPKGMQSTGDRAYDLLAFPDHLKTEYRGNEAGDAGSAIQLYCS